MSTDGWISPDFKRKRGHLRVSGTQTTERDVDLLGVTWEQDTELARDRSRLKKA